MPWANIGQLSDDDLKAMFAYLRTLQPVDNRVPQPVFASARGDTAQDAKGSKAQR
jgi:cytochrome c553